MELFEKTRLFAWVKPQHLYIPPANRNEGMWEFAINSLKEMDAMFTPGEKLECIVECVTIIGNVLKLCSDGKSAIANDDILPIMFYIVIKA